MNLPTFALILVFALKLGQSRLLRDLQKVEYGVLEKGKPIHLDQNYQKVQITGITGTLYADSFSELGDVTVLSITNNQINAIEKGALCSPPNLKALELDFYYTEEPPVLTKDVFHNCDNIEELVLGSNNAKSGVKPQKIEVDILENLSALKELTIRWYNITHLGKHFLKLHGNSLTRLILLECNLEEIDSDALDGFRNLEEFAIVLSRELDHLPRNLFRQLSKLKVLILAHNGIKDLTWDEFEGLSSLRELELSDNQISSYDVEKIARNLPKLEKLNIYQNPPRCKEMEAIVEELKKKLPDLSDVTYKDRLPPAFGTSCENLD